MLGLDISFENVFIQDKNDHEYWMIRLLFCNPAIACHRNRYKTATVRIIATYTIKATSIDNSILVLMC